MKLTDLFEFKQQSQQDDGSYVAEQFDDESQDRLYEFAQELGVKNLVPKDKYHITLIFSKKSLPPSFETIELSEDNSIIVEPAKLNIFQTQEGNNCLVLEFYTRELVKRHEMLMDKYDLQYDFESYIPHCTLSYNCENYEIPTDVDYAMVSELHIINEYHQTLKTNPLNNNLS